MKRLLFTLVCMVLLLPCVSASVSDFNVVNNIKSTLNVGTNVDIGSIVVIKQPYIATNYTVSSFVNATYQRYDNFRWIGAQTVQVTLPSGANVVLVPNDVLQLTQIGNYYFFQVSDTTLNSTFVVVNETPLSINVSSASNSFTITQVQNSVVSGSESVFTFNANVSSSLVAGNYRVDFNVTNGNKTITVSKDMNLPVDGTWIIETDNTTRDINVGSDTFKSIGFLLLKNNGNADTTVSASLTGNASAFIITQNSVQLFKGSQAYMTLMLQVPSQQADGLYQANLTLTGANTTISRVYSIRITDAQVPTIGNITFSQDSLGIVNNITVDIKDNLGTENATLSFDGQTLQMVKDQQFFRVSHLFTEIKEYDFKLCAYDLAKNEACQSFKKTFNKLALVNSSPSIKMSTKKIGSSIEKLLFSVNSSADANITVTLADLTTSIVYDNVTKPEWYYKIMLRDANGNQYPIENIGSNVTIPNAKNGVMLIVQSQNLSTYDLRFSVIVPDYALTVDPINVHGEFRDYDVPEDLNKQFNGKNISCVAYDTGDLETSEYICTQKFNFLEANEIESLPLIATPRERQLAEKSFNDRVDELKQGNMYRNLMISFLAMLVILGVGSGYWFINIYPRTFIIKDK